MNRPDESFSEREAVEIEYLRGQESGHPFDELPLESEHSHDLADLRELRATVERVRDAAAFEAMNRAPPESVGEFQIFEELGKGASGRVYRARRLGADHDVALKLVRLSVAIQSTEAQRLIGATTAAAKLDHPNVARILEHGEVKVYGQRHYYIAMELVEGQTLQKWLAARTEGGTKALDAHEAARIVRDIALGVAHAHAEKIVHRDIKPSNTLIGVGKDSAPRVVLTDFGIAKPLTAKSTVTYTGERHGTPAYMAPEQHLGDPGKVKFAADVYAIGAILYELLHGCRACDDLEHISALRKAGIRRPKQSHGSNTKVPPALETICLRCLEMDPRDRKYKHAGKLAEDLNSCLQGRPTRARRVGRLEKQLRRCRPYAGRIAWSVAACVLVGISLLVTGFLTKQSTLEAESKARKRRADASLIVLAEHSCGWRDHAQRLLSASENPGSLHDLQTAVLMDLDAQPARDKAFLDSLGPATSLAFWGEDKLVCSAYPLENATATRILQLDARDSAKELPSRNQGVVGVRADGRPVQFSHHSGQRYHLFSLERAAHPMELDAGIAAEVEPGVGLRDFRPIVALSKPAEFAAALLKEHEGLSHVVVWDLRTNERLAVLSHDGELRALAIAPDGESVAVGGEHGVVKVWPLAGGHSPIELRGELSNVSVLAFGPRPRRNWLESAPPPNSGFLAAGYGGGAIAIWDLGTTALTTHCRGSWHWVTCLDFSPDGTLLASGGKYDVWLWDSSTGARILKLEAGTNVAAVAFSPKGTQLAAARTPLAVDRGGICRWDLQAGLGFQALRGLAAPVAQAQFSRDSKLVIALASDWTVGVWDLDRRFLVHVLKVPEGSATDYNASMALDRAGEQLVVASGSHATLWDLKSGVVIRHWPLPPGLTDQVAFHDSGAILLLRCEEGRTLRLFDLAPGERKQILELPGFFEGSRRATVAHDGAVFVAEGVMPDAGIKRRVVRAIEGPTGRILWTKAAGAESWLGDFDPTGSVLDLYLPSPGGIGCDFTTVNALTGEKVPKSAGGRCLGPKGELGVRGNLVYRQGQELPLFKLASELELALWEDAAVGGGEAESQYEGLRQRSLRLTYKMEFSPDGRFVTFGMQDGRVMVCDILLVERQLQALGQE